MNRPVSPQPSGLLQQQPQRYSDRHYHQPNSFGKHQTPLPRRPSAAQVSGGPENSPEPDDTAHTSKHDDDQGIKSYLKKTDASDPSRASKPDANKQVEALKGNENDTL